MLHIILLILKIIGIVIACIIGLLLLVICSVLLVSLRYKGNIQFDQQDRQIEYSLRGQWLLWAVSFKVEGKQISPQIVVRIFGYPIINTGKPETIKKVKAPKEETEIAEIKTTEIKSEEKPAEIAENTKVTKPAEATANKENTKAVETAKNTEDTKTEKAKCIQSAQKPQEAQKVSMYGRLLGIKAKVIGKIKHITDALKAKLKKICDTVKNLKHKQEKLFEILFCADGRATIRRLKVQVFKVLKHLKFKKLSGRVHFGFDDPATTGKVLGGLSVFYPVYQENLKIEPDFEHEVLDGDLYVRGRIRVINLLIPALKVKLDKGLNKMIQDIKKL